MTEKCKLVTMQHDDDAVDQMAGSDKELAAQVLSELLSLRSAKGVLSPQKLAKFPTLVEVCGNNDLLDAFHMLRRELQRYACGSQDVAAAALSIAANHDRVLDRLIEVAHRLTDGDRRDQRTARRWSDRGMPLIASDLVYKAKIQGRLGREVLSLELSGNATAGLHLIIDQMTSAELPSRPPDVGLWRYNDQGEPIAVKIDLRRVDGPEAMDDTNGYRMTRHRVHVELAPQDFSERAGKSLSISITGRDAPIRTLFYESRAQLPSPWNARLSVYRSVVSVDLAKEQ